MRVLLKEVLDCHPDAAWRALQSPAVLQEISSPVVSVESLEPGGFPITWRHGAHPVEVTGMGTIPLGVEELSIQFRRVSRGDVRILRDLGRSISGAVSVAPAWDHQAAISAAPGDTSKTLYRDQLIVSAGALTPVLWYSLWLFWQYRAAQLKRLAPTWRYDLGADVEA